MVRVVVRRAIRRIMPNVALCSVISVILILMVAGCSSKKAEQTKDEMPKTEDEKPAQMPADSCSDSDNGQDFNTKGTATGVSSGKSFTKEDSCRDSETLLEQYCIGKEQAFAEHSCKCSDGACQKQIFNSTLSISSNVSAIIVLDGDEKGSTPQNFVVPPGLHTIVLKAKGYKNYTKQIATYPGTTTKVDAELEKLQTGDVKIDIVATYITGRRTTLKVTALNPAGIEELKLYTNKGFTARYPCNFAKECLWSQQVVRFTSGVYNYSIVMVDVNNQTTENSIKVLST